MPEDTGYEDFLISQGEYETEKDYSEDPMEIAKREKELNEETE